MELTSRPRVEYELSVPHERLGSEVHSHIENKSVVEANPFQAAAQKGTRRDRVQILLKMLQSANVPIRKTHLMYGAGINFYQLEKHLAFLIGTGMIEELRQEDDAIAYRTTEKGRLFSQLFA
jgi:predicted transcriptional regulator